MKAHHQSGFTLWELMLAVTVAGIVLGLAVPNMREFQRNSAVIAAANDLVTGTLLARSEAVKRQAPVTLCLSDDPTSANPPCALDSVVDSTDHGFVVWVDNNGDGVFDDGEEILLQNAAPTGTIRVSANCGYVVYGRNGFSRPITGACSPPVRAVLYCDDRGNRAASGTLSTARIVRIDRPGRGQVFQEVADVGDAIDDDLDAINPTCP